MRYHASSKLSRFVKSFLFSGGFIIAEAAPLFNYGEALQKSIWFYEVQRSGPLLTMNRVEWRGPSGLEDGQDVGLDLTGGWYDAGDHVKFNFPMAASATLLAWAVAEYPLAYSKSGQLGYILDNLKWTSDYFVKCHSAPNELYGQVGDGNKDHAWWGPVEVMQMERPSFKIDATKPGSDLAGETAAALASASILFRASDAVYADKLLLHAKQLYTFAETYPGKYSDAIPNVQGFYTSWSGYNDELVWGALWLYLATKDAAYLAKAEAGYANLNTEPQSTIKTYKWTHAWDDKTYGCFLLLAKITGKAQYKANTEKWLDFWTVGTDGQRIAYTPGGLAWLDQWGSLRYVMNTSLMAFIYSDWVTDATKKSRYHDFAVRQVNFVLGQNSRSNSYMVGFGNNPPTKPHHRTAHGSWADAIIDPIESRHILYGALVGGPGKDDSYTDSRQDYVTNEVATDYNSGFTGALARMYHEFGGTPLANFPPAETKTNEFEVGAKVNASGNGFTEISIKLQNKSAWPARMGDKLKVRYYVNLTEVFAAGFNASKITVSLNYNQDNSAKSAILKVADTATQLYYIEIDYTGANLYPGGQSHFSKELQFRMSLPNNSALGAWNPDNDFSFDGLANQSTHLVNGKIPVYENGVQVSGAEPGKPPVGPLPWVHNPFIEPVYKVPPSLFGGNIPIRPFGKISRSKLVWHGNQNRITLACNATETCQLRIYNLRGSLVSQGYGKSINGVAEILIPALPMGVYQTEVVKKASHP